MTISNRLNAVFESKKKLLSIFLTAGYPNLESTVPLLAALQESGVDFVEIGFPFSDPLADGPTIQHSNEVAIKNGMTLEILFEQLREVRKTVTIPLLLMGYLNPVLQFGIERFCKECEKVGIDGIIVPDLPVAQFISDYRALFTRHTLHNILLVTPATSAERIAMLDAESSSFMYAVSSAAITGGSIAIDAAREAYFKKLSNSAVTHPMMVGFGIGDRTSFELATKYCAGAIVGSAFIKQLGTSKNAVATAREFSSTIRSA